MLKNLFIFVLLFIFIDASGQSRGNHDNFRRTRSKKINVQQNNRVIGMNLLNQEAIYANEYILPERIHKFYLDTTTNYLTLQLRSASKDGKVLNTRGNLVLYDLNRKEVRWKKIMLYQSNSLFQYGNTLIFNKGTKSYRLNVDNGNEIWDLRNTIYYLDHHNHIGIGYRNKILDDYVGLLEGIDLKHGYVIWQKHISREYGWNDIIRLDDHSLLIVAAGLHQLNIRNGNGWDYSAVTAEKDITRAATATAAGIALGLFTGTYVVTTGYDLIRDLVSNTIVDQSDIYFASKEKLVRINKQTGEVIWTYTIPPGMASKSTLFLRDSLIYIVNSGSAMRRNKKLNYGTPFFAAFEKSTGKQHFFALIQTRNDPIVDFRIEEEHLKIMFEKRLFKYSLKNGVQLQSKTIDKRKGGKLSSFISDHVYIKLNNNKYSPLTSMDTTNTYLLTKEGKTLVLDSSFHVAEEISFDQLFIRNRNIKEYKFITNDNQTIMLDSLNEKIAEIEATHKAILLGNTLYDINENKFVEIRLDSLLKTTTDALKLITK